MTFNKIYQGDCREIMRDFPDKSFHAIVTDPVWPNCDVGLAGTDRATELFAEAAKEFPRLTDRVVIVLGCHTDPRFLAGMPKELPFIRVCWMKRVPAVHRGPILHGAEVAYVFGNEKFLSVKGTRVMPGEVTNISEGSRDPDNNHPCPRALKHMEWLIHWFTRAEGGGSSRSFLRIRNDAPRLRANRAPVVRD